MSRRFSTEIDSAFLPLSHLNKDNNSNSNNNKELYRDSSINNITDSLVISQITPRKHNRTQSSSSPSSSPNFNNNNNNNSNNAYSSPSSPSPSSSPSLSSSPKDNIINNYNSSNNKEELEYGFVPRSIINAVKDKDWKVRSEAIEKLYGLVRGLPAVTVSGSVSVSGSLFRFLSSLLADPNFTICLNSIRLVGELVPKLLNVKSTLSSFLPNLIEKFGDSKIIIRQETMKVVSKIMQIVSPSDVIDTFKSCYAEKSPNIQQHLLIVIIKALLVFKDHPFDYSSIIPILILSLNSSKAKVKQAGIEALALVRNHLTESQANSILEPVLVSNCDQETVQMLMRRFSRGQLPILSHDGNVEFRVGADGSVTDESFDPAVVNQTPAPSPGPSRTHTPMSFATSNPYSPHSPSHSPSPHPHHHSHSSHSSHSSHHSHSSHPHSSHHSHSHSQNHSNSHHTLHTSSYSTMSSEDVSLSDLRPARHWSAGAKTPTQTKLPPWFPIASPSTPSSPLMPSSPSVSSGSFSPSTPTATLEESHSTTDVRRSVFQRTRSLSLTDKLNVSNSNNEDNSIFRNNNPYSVPAGNTQGGYYYNSAVSSPVNLPPITTGLPIPRNTSPTFSPTPDTFFNGVMPNLDSDVRKPRIRPPSPSLISASNSPSFSTMHATIRDTGYTPSFGKKGSGGMSQPSSAYPIPFDLDPPASDPFSGNNINSTFHTMRPTKNSLTVLTNFEDNTNNNTFEDPALQHRAKIWSTLKPSALATFPQGNTDPPKRRFSGRARKELTASDGTANIDSPTTSAHNSNYGILENVEDDFDFNTPATSAPKSEHPKSATRRQQQMQQASDDLQHIKSMPAPHGMVAPTSQDPPRAVSVMGTANTASKTPTTKRGHSRHLSRDRDAENSASPVQTPVAPTSSASGPRVVNTSPQDIIPTEQLLPFDNPELELKQVIEWFANGEWYHQFEALASIRILMAYHPRVIIPQIHPMLTLVLNATNNLRSLVSRHALVAIGDLFKHAGKHIEPHLDEIMLKVLKKYNESNNFLEKELDRAMGLMLLNVGEARAVGVLLVSAGNKAAPVRCKVAFFLANLVDILGNRIWNMREADRVMTVVIQLIQESSAEARAQGRRALYLMHQSDPDEFQRVLRKQCNEAQLRKCQEVLEKIISCGDPVTLGAKKPSSAKPARTPKSAGSSSPSLSSPESSPSIPRERIESKEPSSPLLTPASPEKRRETPVRGRSPMRDMSKAVPISSNALPELDPILNDMDNTDWRTRYNGIVALVDLSTRDAKTQTILSARVVKIFDHLTPRLQDANSKVNMHALTSLKQLIPQLTGLDSVLGVLVPSLIINLASTKNEPRLLSQEALEELLIYVDPAALVPHLSSGFASHANPKVKVVLLQMMGNIAQQVYSSKPSVVIKHILPIAFKLLDDKKGEMRTVNTKLLQSLFKAMGNALWENSNAFNLSKQDQTRLHEILTS